MGREEEGATKSKVRNDISHLLQGNSISIRLSLSLPLSIFLLAWFLESEYVGNRGTWRWHKVNYSQSGVPFETLQEVPVGFEFLCNYSCPLTALYLNVKRGQRLGKRDFWLFSPICNDLGHLWTLKAPYLNYVVVCTIVCLHLHIARVPLIHHIKIKTGPHLLCILTTVLYRK